MEALLLVPVLLIGINALFVLMEYALVRARPARLEMLARKGNAQAAGVQDMQAHLDDYLAAVQVGITFIALALGWIGEPTIGRLLGSRLGSLGLGLSPESIRNISFGAALALLTWAQIVFAELVPRAISIQKAEAIAMLGAAPLRLFVRFFRFPVAFMSLCSRTFLRIAGLKPASESEAAVSLEEMRVQLGETQEKGSLPLERLLLLENIFDFGAAKVSEAMVPRERIVSLSLKKTWEENLATIRARRFSRYPLCEDGLDTAVGMVHLKDMVLRAEDGMPPDLRRARREMTEVSEGDPLEKLLKLFPDKGIHMALVRDAQGRISGLLTLEDILEELVGEVHDEFDLPEAWSLTDMIVSDAVAVQMQAPDRRSAVAQLVGKLAAAVPGLKEAEVFQAVWDREMKFSSAVGRGVAVPHGRLSGLERPLIALGRFAKPVPFPSPDAVPVRLVFLILTPAAFPVVQLRVLGRIASIVTNENLRRRLLRAKTAESLLETLRTGDTILAA